MENENLNFMSEVMNKIKNRRNELDISYQDLANRTGLSKSTLQRYETGSIKNMPIDKLELIANALDLSPAYLMGWEEKENTKKINQNKDSISIEEEKLLHNFNKLNDLGKKKVINYSSDLSEIGKYSNQEFKIETMAAHNDHLDNPGEIDKIMQDFEEMDKW
ncbi:helix-turn-helix domain-containing protein [Faecalimicrobium sp. JNUCC 81]